MAPGMSVLTPIEEEAVRQGVRSHRPSLKIDLLTASAAVTEGENFMSDVIRVDVVARDTELGECVDLRLILKRLPQCDDRRILFHCDDAFQNEAAFYHQVLPVFKSQARCVDLSFAPCLQADGDFVLLRHLGQDGFVMADRKKGFDFTHCRLVMQELAKFHAVSFALKHNNPEEFSKITSSVKGIFITEDNLILNPSVDHCIDMSFKAATNADTDVINKLKNSQGHGFEVLNEMVTPSEPMSVIIHGDMWSNNLLFRYQSEDRETPSDVCFLDLQNARYGSPALDILYFLFSSTKVGILRENFHQLLSIYYQSLEDHVVLFAPRAKIPSFTEFMTDLKNHAMYGLIMSLMVLPVVTAEKAVVNLDVVNEESFYDEEFLENAEKDFVTPEYKRRVNEIFHVCSSQKLF